MGSRVVGVAGCNAGWVVVLRDLTHKRHVARVVANFAAVLALPEAPKVIGVDIPIGLLDVAVAGGRTCETDARQLMWTSFGHEGLGVRWRA